MTAPGPAAPPYAVRPSATSEVGTALWALIPILTCGFGSAIAFGVALAKHRTALTLVGLIVYSGLAVGWIGLAGTYGDQAPPWADAILYAALPVMTVGASLHLFVIRSRVWAPWPGPHGTAPQSATGMPGGPDAVDHARRLRHQARQTIAADPMLAKRLAIGRPDLPRQFDDGGLVDLNHAPVPVLRSLPGVTETGARQIRDRVERLGPFQSLGEVLLVIDISPNFEHHLREYVVFIP